jgi:hypothetical protein
MDNIIIKQVINELFERGLIGISEYNKLLVLINSNIISSKVKQSELEKIFGNSVEEEKQMVIRNKQMVIS